MKPSNHKKAAVAVLGACALIVLAGCASIVNGGPGKVFVKSQPSEAKVSVFNSKGSQIISANTPAELQLDRGAGYFSRARYTLKVEKDGYRPVEVEIHGTMNGWYAGNLLFGGLVGLLIVDPLTGAMWHLEPKNVDVNLPAGQAGVYRNAGGLVVVLKENMTAEQMARATPVIN